MIANAVASASAFIELFGCRLAMPIRMYGEVARLVDPGGLKS
jgi:hypothetical protein